MAKSKISPMTIIDIQDNIFYVVTYRNITYLRVNQNFWKEYLPEGNYPNMIDVFDYSFIQHLNKAFNHHFEGKTITKETKILID